MNMTDTVYYIICGVLTLGVLLGISMMSKVKRSVAGNAISALCTAAAIAVTLYKYQILTDWMLWAALAIGATIGLVITVRVKMIQMPQMVALLNGLGGAASALVAGVTLLAVPADTFSRTTSGLALAVGMLTLTGSLVAALKLHGKMNQKPVILRGHQAIVVVLLLLTLGSVGLMVPFASGTTLLVVSLVCLVASALFGHVFAIRVGGADMPVTISLLNSFSGVAGAIAGMAISDPLLVAIGGVVGASGLLLTQAMCKAMNRKLSGILLGKLASPAPAAPAAVPVTEAQAAAQEIPMQAEEQSPAQTAAAALQKAKKVILVPGYGMAVAQAQSLVKQLYDKLESEGKAVDFAIHPVAGRMPGHMNVLLAEVDVPYEKLLELEEVNPQFADCDVAMVIGANDVVNPAANTAEGTPIYGMPVLNAELAKTVVVCNFDTKPGYAGVENPLYTMENTTMLLGDAKQTLQELLGALNQKDVPATDSTAVPSPAQTAAAALQKAKKVILVPGYGMAVAQAQSLVKQLYDKLESEGKTVDFAIHPVAGRMPGHMNVLLAEVDVPYEKLLELEEVNPQFADCDVAMVIGANDVVNPAANTAEGTPIYGMPVLNAELAKTVVVCNFDTKPGYAGVENPLYTMENTTMLLGDAKQTLQELLGALNQKDVPATDSTAVPSPAQTAAAALQKAKKVILVPGYGMAVAQAQSLVKQLYDKLESEGKTVDFAIHPVAGRMPGHMNVLLAEVDVPYEKLLELEEVNPQFADCDVAMVIGANDVVNPAANTAEGTPIYGMPVLNAELAKTVVVCNFDTKPGYAGVENPLYTMENTTMLLGDAKQTLQELLAQLP